MIQFFFVDPISFIIARKTNVFTVPTPTGIPIQNLLKIILKKVHCQLFASRRLEYRIFVLAAVSTWGGPNL